MALTNKKSLSSRRTQKQRVAELEAQLKNLQQQEKSVKSKLSKLECSIIALPANVQEARLRNWNTLPAEESNRRARGSKATRAQDRVMRDARARQALFALFLIGVLLVFGLWFFIQLKAHYLWY